MTGSGRAPTRDAPAPGTPDGAPTREDDGSRRSVVVALLANLAVAASKLVGFLLTGSSSLLAETGHSLADTANQGLLLVGARAAGQPPSPTHPFGRGRERYFWSFVVGQLLFTLGGLAALYEGVARLRGGGETLGDAWVAIALLLVAGVAEATSLRTALRHASTERLPGDSWLRHVRRSRDPEVTVVIVEDAGALAGLLLALLGVVATQLTGDARYDAAATIGIGLLLCVLAAFLSTEMHSLLVGEPVRAHETDRLHAAVAAVDGVAAVLNLRTEHIGPQDVLVCVKVALEPPADLDRVVAVIDDVDAAVAVAVPDLLTCFVEVDHLDPARVGQAWT